jgi:hypothetical protein
MRHISTERKLNQPNNLMFVMSTLYIQAAAGGASYPPSPNSATCTRPNPNFLTERQTDRLRLAQWWPIVNERNRNFGALPKPNFGRNRISAETEISQEMQFPAETDCNSEKINQNSEKIPTLSKNGLMFFKTDLKGEF